MSKAVRLKDYLADELEKMAARENRSLANLVNHLLEQAVEMERRRKTGAKPPEPDPSLVSQVTRDRGSHHPAQADSQSRDVAARTVAVDPDVGFRPDPKPERKKK